MKTILHAFLLLLIASGILSSCSPDDEPHYLGEFRLGTEGEAYIKFEPGSYWVYQNDQTGEIDSIVMQWYRSNMKHLKGERNDFYREDISFRWDGSVSGRYDFNTLHPFADLTTSSLLVSVHHFAMPCSKSKGTTSMMYMPVAEGRGGGVSGQITVLNQVHDSLQVQGQWYYDVAEFEVDIDYVWDNKITKYYWAKHVGLIKREKYAHWTREYIEGWELINYDVTQA